MDNQFPLPGPVSIAPPPPPVNPVEVAPPPGGNVLKPAHPSNIVKPSILKLALIGGGAILIVVLIFLLIRSFSSKSSTSENIGTKSTTPTKIVTLNYYGLWEPASVMRPVLDAFEKENPTIKVNYQPQSHQDYQERLKTSLESATPPDVFRIHTTWIPLFVSLLLPAPANTLSATEITTNFYPIVGKMLIANNQVYGAPMTMEGLGLYINSAMLQQKQLKAPKTWEDLLTAAKVLKESDPLTGKIIRAGVALGNTSNVDHWPDIVSLMLLQAGVKLTNMKSPEVSTTIQYYVDFVAKHKVWDETMPPSTVAFANEKVAMIIAPSWRAREIKAMNPALSWEVVPVPQLPDVEPLNWASVWFEAVAKNSKYPTESWKLVSFLASANAQQILFDSAAADRGFPQPPANKAVVTASQKNPIIAPFLSSMETASTFYTASMTRDSKTALNSRLIKYLEDAINSFNLKQDQEKIIETLDSGFVQVLSQYGLVAAPTPTTNP